ncbi:MAG TPA: TRAP transporter small permease [Burkholderiales bacterium]|nr:TRAP transporter small permease [Burkholderiales bacterium]
MFRLLQVLAAATLFALMCVVAVDVTGRYVFNRPLPAGYEMVQALMGVLLFVTLPLVSRNNDHIALGLLDPYFAGRLDWLRRGAIHLFSAAVLGFVTWRLAVHAAKLAQGGDLTPVLQMPLAPIAWFMAAAAALSSALLLALAFRCFSQRRPS